MGCGRPGHLRGTALAVFVGALASSSLAVAQTTMSLPPLTECKSAAPPMLPKRWRAVGLLMPFLEGQLSVGEFIYDSTVPAMRASVYGLESGAVDLLLTDTETFQLFGPHRSPTSCISLQRKLSLPSPRWPSEQGVCVGDAVVGSIPVEWWKAPGSGTQAHWYWFRSDTKLPWRTLFLTPSSNPAIIGNYAMTYFPTFAEQLDTNLASLRQFCMGQAQNVAAAAADAAGTRGLSQDAESERLDRIATLIPGLDHRGCAHAKIPSWPERFAATAFLTPISFNDNPTRALILYDWNETTSQFGVMFQNTPPQLKALVALKKNVGYRIYPSPSGPTCEAVYPGLVRPDWMKTAGCKCKGVIDHNPALSPNDVAQIMMCPIKWQQPRIMWSWYTENERPVVFAEPGARGDGGVMLADYDQWLPGAKITAANFDLPKECVAPDKAIRPPGDPHTLANASCSDCHTTPW